MGVQYGIHISSFYLLYVREARVPIIKNKKDE